MEKRWLYGKNLRAADTENPQIVADFAVFGDTYDMGWGSFERVDPHAFDSSLGNDVRALLNHNSDVVLGRTKAGTLHLSVDDYALRGAIDINPDDSQAMDLYARVKRGDVSQCSFGFEPIREEIEELPDGGRMFVLKELDLWEVSVVTFPAYSATSASVRSSERSKAAFEAWKARQKARITPNA